MPTPRNVLFIVVDQWRGDTLANLGHPCIRTPNLDTLCREGMTFRNHYAQCAPCAPARASLLTGLYQMNHRVVQNGIPLDARHVTLPQEIRQAGYDPALIGYTTTTPDPRTTHPDDSRFRYLGDTMEGWSPIAPLDPGRRPYFDWLRQRGIDVPGTPSDIWLPADGYETDGGATRAPSRIPHEFSDTAWTTEHGLAYLRGMEGRNWFLHLGYFRPHPPFIAPAPYNDAYDPDAAPAPVRAASPEAEGAQHPLLAHYMSHVKQAKFFQDGRGLASAMDESAVRRMRAAYYGLISEIDDHLGRVLDYLKQSGQYDDTLIVFTSDHGEQLGDHHLLGKLGYFDESFHVPLVIRDPSVSADDGRGGIVDQFTESIDIMPTVLDWLGRPSPRQCEGHSLLPFCRGEDPSGWRREVHYEFDIRPYYDEAAASPPCGLSLDQCGLSVIRDERYKYVHFSELPALFFDLAEDPSQLRNRADDPACAPQVLEYAQKLLSWRIRHAERTLTAYSATPDGLIDRA